MSWGPFVGSDVWIEWRDPYDDWRWYRVVKVVDTKHGIALLEGIDAPDGSKHDGSQFRALWKEINRIKFAEAARP